MDLYTPQELARLLHLSTSRVRALAREGKIHASHATPGGHRRYTQEDLARAQQLVGGAPEVAAVMPAIEPIHLHARETGDPLMLAVMSPAGGAGATTLAMNLAAAFARLGQFQLRLSPPRVLLIDGDLSGSSIATKLGFEYWQEPGVADPWVIGRGHPTIVELVCHLDEHPQLLQASAPGARPAFTWRCPELAELHVLAGPIDSRFAEDMCQDDYANLISYLAPMYDVIVMDCGNELWAPHNVGWLRAAGQVVITGQADERYLRQLRRSVKQMMKGSVPPVQTHQLELVLRNLPAARQIARLDGLANSLFTRPLEPEQLHLAQDHYELVLKAHSDMRFAALADSAYTVEVAELARAISQRSPSCRVELGAV